MEWSRFFFGRLMSVLLGRRNLFLRSKNEWLITLGMGLIVIVVIGDMIEVEAVIPADFLQ